MKELTLFEGGHPFSTADFSWLQLAMQENMAAVLGTMLPSGSDAAIISGCVLDGSSTSVTISDGLPGDWTIRKAGQLIYQGKIYDVLPGDVSGSFGSDPADEVGLKMVLRENASAYPTVFYANNVERTVYSDYVMELVTSGWDVPMAGLSLISNNAQSGTVVGFMPPAGSVLTDFVDPITHTGKGRWRGWRRLTEANGRVLVGLDATQPEFDTIGETGGAKTHTLTLQQIPYHHHAVWNNSPSGVSGGVNTYLGNVDGSGAPGSGATLTREIYPDGVDINAAQNARGSLATDPATMGQAHNNLQPYLTLVWMIKL